MTKPNWYNAPDWAQYLAQYWCGEWYWYEKSPVQLSTLWVSASDSRITSDAATAENWKSSLEPRP